MRYMQNPISKSVIHCSRAQAQSLARYQWVRVEWDGKEWKQWQPKGRKP